MIIVIPQNIFQVIFHLRFENILWQELPKDIFITLVNFINNEYKDNLTKLIYEIYESIDQLLVKHSTEISDNLIKTLPQINKFFELDKEIQILLIKHIFDINGQYINNRTIKNGMIEDIIECSELYFFLKLLDRKKIYLELKDCTLENYKCPKWLSNTIYPNIENPYEMFYNILNYRIYFDNKIVQTHIGFKPIHLFGYHEGKIEAKRLIKLNERKKLIF